MSTEPQKEWAKRWANKAIRQMMDSSEWFEDADEGWKLKEAFENLSDDSVDLMRDDLASLFCAAHQERIKNVLL